MLATAGAGAAKGSHNLVRRSRAELDASVLQIVRAANQPIGAYEIANRLGASGHPTVPNQVYRVLNRLIGSGHVRRIESLAAFIVEPGRESNLICLCDSCHAVCLLSLPGLSDQLHSMAAQSRFRVTKIVAEVTGTCAACRDKS